MSDTHGLHTEDAHPNPPLTPSMARLDDALNRSPPPHLYHYTDQTGFLGIIEKGELWATKVQYMNDTTEFSIAVERAKQRLRSRFNAGSTLEQLAINEILLRLDNILNVNLCAVSFCEAPDLLSQWRGYTGGVGGIAIGFDSSALRKVVHREGGRFGPCIYDKTMQDAILDNLVENVLEEANALSSPIGDIELLRIAASFDERLITIGAFFKDSGFVEEREWRLVTGIVAYSDERFCFRSGKSMLMPFYKVKIKMDELKEEKNTVDWKGEIVSVTIGPCPHPVASTHAVHGLLLKHGIVDGASERDEAGRLSYPNVIPSKLPYRNW